MDFSCKTRALSSLMTDIKNNKFSFDSPLQREEEQWNSLMKSELIDSLITGYPIDPARASKEMNGKKEVWEIFDGKQRIDINNFLIWYADNIHQDKIDTLKEAMEKLDSLFEEKISIKSSTTPMLLAASYKVIKNKQSFGRFVDKIKEFIQGYDKNEKYKEFLVSGTSAQNMVEGRWNYWKNIIKGV